MWNVLFVDVNSIFFLELLGVNKSFCINDGIYFMDFVINSGKFLVVCGFRFMFWNVGCRLYCYVVKNVCLIKCFFCVWNLIKLVEWFVLFFIMDCRKEKFIFLIWLGVILRLVD